MYKLNWVFEELRKVILKESYDGDEKFLKIVILWLVIYYIFVLVNILEKDLEDDSEKNENEVELMNKWLCLSDEEMLLNISIIEFGL